MQVDAAEHQAAASGISARSWLQQKSKMLGLIYYKLKGCLTSLGGKIKPAGPPKIFLPSLAAQGCISIG